MAALLFAMPVLAGRSQEGPNLRIYMEIISQDQAWADFLSHWDSFRDKLEKGDEAGAKKDLDTARESRLNGGIGDLPAYSAALIHLAADRPGSAEWLLPGAVSLSPGSAEVELMEARFYLGGGAIHLGETFRHYLAAWQKAPDDFSFRLRLTARLLALPLVFGTLFGVLFSVALMFRHLAILRHDFSDFFTAAGLPGWAVAGLLAVTLLIPWAAGLSWWWLIGWWMLLFGLYLKPGEIILAGIYVSVMFCSPLLLQQYARMASAPADAKFSAVLRVQNGLPTAEDLAVLAAACPADPGLTRDRMACFSLARLLARQARLDEALALYDQLSDDPGLAQEAYINRAEVLFFKPEPEGKTLEGALAKVEKTLKEAETRGPDRMEVQYNFGRYYQFSDSTKMTNTLGRARELGGNRMKSLDAVYFERTGYEEGEDGKEYTVKRYRLNRLFATAPVPAAMLEAEFGRDTDLSRSVYEGLWIKWLGPGNELSLWAALSGCVAVFVVLLIVRRGWAVSYRCASCGRPICARCEPPAKDPAICSPCYYVFRDTASMVDLQVKMQKRAEAQYYKDRWNRGGLIASLILPGSGLLARGFAGTGGALLILATLLLSAAATDWVVWPSAGPAFAPGFYAHQAAGILAYVALMIVSLLIYRSRTE